MSILANRTALLVTALLMMVGTFAALGTSANAAPASTSSAAPAAAPMSAGTAKTVAPAPRLAAYRNYFGAISLNVRDGASGWSYDYRTKKKARRLAQQRCRNHANYPRSCVKAVWVRNGCAAVAVRYRANGTMARWGWGVAYTKKAAIRKAKRGAGKGSVRHTAICTTRYRR